LVRIQYALPSILAFSPDKMAGFLWQHDKTVRRFIGKSAYFDCLVSHTLMQATKNRRLHSYWLQQDSMRKSTLYNQTGNMDGSSGL